MARFLHWSDLHREFGSELWPVLFPQPTADCPAGSIDAILIAGDLSAGDHQVETLKEIHTAWGVPVIAIRGNHEAYKHEMNSCYRSQAELAQQAQKEGFDVRILDRGTAVIGDTRILGATLWTDFNIIGKQEEMMFGSKYIINDYRKIAFERDGAVDTLDPSDVLALHLADREWLLGQLATQWDGKTVVMTHHLPVPEALAPESKKGGLAPAYVSDLREEILPHRIDAWVSGHTHWARRGLLDGLRGPIAFTANMQGYPGDKSDFEPYRVLDIECPGLGLSPLTIAAKELAHLEPADSILRRLCEAHAEPAI